jgi:hypothetical protein
MLKVVEALETVLSSNPIKKKRTKWGTVPRKQLAIRNQGLLSVHNIVCSLKN